MWNDIAALLTQRLIAVLGYAAMLTMLALSLSGCATPSLPLPVKPEIPPPPALTEPLPSQTYSEQWRQKAESWRQRVTGTPVTSAR